MGGGKPCFCRAESLALAMYLLDTDVLIWVLRGNKKYVSLLEKLKDKGSIAISTITIAEIYKNIFPSELIPTESFINQLEIINVTATVAKQAGFYWQQYVKRFKNLNLIDCIIAATCKEKNCALVTLNKRHYPMTDIKLLDI